MSSPSLTRQRQIVLLLAMVFALLAIFPYVLHTFHPSFQGFTVIRDKDFGNYYSRFERALTGHPEEAGNGITPVGSGITGMQDAGMEAAIGTPLSWTGLSAPPLAIIISAMLTGVSFFLFYSLFLLLGYSHRLSLLVSSTYYFVLLHVVSRVVHPGWSLVLVLLSLLSFIRFLQAPTLLRAIVAGLLLALLPYVYFWAWTYVWAVCFFAALFFAFTSADDGIRKRVLRLSPIVAVLLLLSLPVVWRVLFTLKGPLGEEVFLRSDFLDTRGVESPIRSVLILVQALLVFSLFPRYKRDSRYVWVLACLFGIVAAMHQNVLHGKLLMFSSHFYPFLMISTLIAGCFALSMPRGKHPAPHQVNMSLNGSAMLRAFSLRDVLILFITLLFLAGAAVDYLPGYKFFVPTFPNFSDQHLLPAIAVLQGGERETVLTDMTTGRVVTAWTDSGIVYTTHSRFLFISDADMAERYCVSTLFSPTFPEAHRALYMEYNAILDSKEMRDRERALVSEACTRVRKAPLEYLRKYGITHVLWNSEGQPDWKMKMYPELRLDIQTSGTGFTLYRWVL